MLVKMRSTAAGPEGVLESGGVYDLPPGQAKAFVAGGFAVPAPAKGQAQAAAEPEDDKGGRK